MAHLTASDKAGALQSLTQAHALYMENRSGVEEMLAAGEAFAKESMAAFTAAHTRASSNALHDQTGATGEAQGGAHTMAAC